MAETTKQTDYVKAAADARQLLRGFRAFDEMAEAFESVGQMIAAKQEAEKTLADVSARIDAAKAELWAVNGSVVKVAADAKAHAASVIKTAEKRAADLIAGAEKNAAEAKEAADALMADAKAALTAARKEAALAVDVRDAAQRELAEIEDKLEKARKQIAKLLG
jgi:hypothetical protein